LLGVGAVIGSGAVGDGIGVCVLLGLVSLLMYAADRIGVWLLVSVCLEGWVWLRFFLF
jgi:hypothetical protein